MTTLATWAARWLHNMPPAAQAEFSQILQPHEFGRPETGGQSEGAVQANIRLAASKEFRAPLWRNNSGAMVDENGRHVRFGLGNDSKKLNAVWKSADLIGLTPVHVGPEHYGQIFGVFTAIEVKEPGWTLRPGDARAQAQGNFLNAVQSMGGIAGFAQSVDDMHRIIKQEGGQ